MDPAAEQEIKFSRTGSGRAATELAGRRAPGELLEKKLDRVGLESGGPKVEWTEGDAVGHKGVI